MLSVKQDLLAALAAALDTLSPGTAARAAFESPKVAAHGDFACTAAMQLAKPLKLKPRQLAETAAQRTAGHAGLPALGRCGHRDRRPRLPQHPPQARRQAGSRARGAGRRRAFRSRPSAARRCWSSSSRPTPPARCTWATAARRRWAMRICNLFATQGCRVHREFYYNDAGVQIQTLTHSTQLRAKGFKPGDACWPTDPENPASKAFYNGDYIQTSPTTSWRRRPSRPTTANSPPAATSTTSNRSASSPWPTCATSRTRTCRPST